VAGKGLGGEEEKGRGEKELDPIDRANRGGVPAAHWKGGIWSVITRQELKERKGCGVG